jgi:hypothetical protein
VTFLNLNRHDKKFYVPFGMLNSASACGQGAQQIGEGNDPENP